MPLKISHILTYPAELRATLQWKFFHAPVYRSQDHTETQTHDLKECWRFLALTSRSFVAVIQQLHPELLMPVCIFYLALRSLDTIEDDKTLPTAVKEPLLRDFDQHLNDETWTFDGSGPDERDREVLVKFDCVAREYKKLKEEYRVIIADITKRMGAGMADYAVSADTTGVQTVRDYELYCHYVAGLVGEGVTRMFVIANLAEPSMMEKPELAESMAQLLQQTNIIRDVHEDHLHNRHFWPTEVLSKHVEKISDLFQENPHSQRKALQCMSEMVLMALERVPECLSYMASVREQSVFNFVAIPQTMAMATLELCFQNPSVFERNIKITRGVACQLLIYSTKDLRYVAKAFSRYAAKIQQKNQPEDPNYSKIDAACNAIIQSTHRLLVNYKPPRVYQTRGVKTNISHTALVAVTSLALLGFVTAVLLYGFV